MSTDAARRGPAIGGGPVPGSGERPLDTLRPGSARVLCVVWWVVSALALADIARSGRDRESLVVALGLLASDALVLTTLWRPGLSLFTRHLVIAGALRTVSVRMAAVTGAQTPLVLRIRVGERVLSTGLVSTSPRAARRARQRAAPAPTRGFGLPGLGSGGAGPGRGGPAPRDRRIDDRTAEAIAAVNETGYAATRIVELAARARRDEPAPDLRVVTRWVWWPTALTSALALAAVLAGVL